MKKTLTILLVVLTFCFASVSIASMCELEQGAFDVAVSIVPDPGCINDEVTASVTITNTGECTDKYRIVSRIVLMLPDIRTIEICEAFIKLEPGKSKTLSITQEIPDFIPPDTYTVKVNVVSTNGKIRKNVPVSLTVEECPETPEEQIAEILTFFNASVESKTLQGEGSGNSAKGRMGALRNMIEATGNFIESGDYERGCLQLLDAYYRCDSEPKPPDFVTGRNTTELAVMIMNLRLSMGCQQERHRTYSHDNEPQVRHGLPISKGK